MKIRHMKVRIKFARARPERNFSMCLSSVLEQQLVPDLAGCWHHRMPTSTSDSRLMTRNLQAIIISE